MHGEKSIEGNPDKFPEINVSIMDNTKSPYPYEGGVARVTTYR
jgi:hypothetical protein